MGGDKDTIIGYKNLELVILGSIIYAHDIVIDTGKHKNQYT